MHFREWIRRRARHSAVLRGASCSRLRAASESQGGGRGHRHRDCLVLRASGCTNELVFEPTPHGRATEREIVTLAVLCAAFLAREHAPPPSRVNPPSCLSFDPPAS